MYAFKKFLNFTLNVCEFHCICVNILPKKGGEKKPQMDNSSMFIFVDGVFAVMFTTMYSRVEQLSKYAECNGSKNSHCWRS